MSGRTLSAIAYLAILSAPLVSGCQHLEHTYRDIVLDDFSDRNYVELNRGLGSPACVYGRLSIDPVHHSVHFALQPIETEGIIDIGFSRIISGLSYERVYREGMADGESHRVCGTIRDATPFRQCDHDRCKWYKLENAELQRGPPRAPIPVAADRPAMSPSQVVSSISLVDGEGPGIFGVHPQPGMQPSAPTGAEAPAQPATVYAAGGPTCVRTFDRVNLRGQVRFENRFGPPGFGETPARDQRRIIPMLVLDHPINICPGRDDEIDTGSIYDVTRIQLIYTSTHIRRSEGPVTVTGELQRATNAFHYVPVTLVVDAPAAGRGRSASIRPPR